MHTYQLQISVVFLSVLVISSVQPQEYNTTEFTLEDSENVTGSVNDDLPYGNDGFEPGYDDFEPEDDYDEEPGDDYNEEPDEFE